MLKLNKTKSLILILTLLISGCASVPVQKTQVNTLQVLQRLDEFQDLVIDLYNTKQITADHALLYSKFVVSSTRTIKSASDGWVPVVKAGWVELKLALPIERMEVKVQFAAKVLDTLVMGLQ